ncbi:hypothetical protein PNEG_01757 [Pneumocystis murina B123]|uniref:60S ribosomal protein L13 n=1 Tax=Pneumocystis murina (strain B123) TaxID=1069680 RepID=M7PHR3_PNEMU|nr:hypothetical protein PNEG_01757 [Pneumocystis murina B123]EMR09999.1 hypothetical protein PNEG_01757 [Pneumocystis murina B123]
MSIKHNNMLPNQHFRKHWQKRVRTWFNQPGRKLRRRKARQEKAARLAPRPVGMLRPTVFAPTVKYNYKLRLGRGFTFEELKAAGISKRYAATIGISVDHRRRNRCLESLERNVKRLMLYKTHLIVFPRKTKKTKKSDTMDVCNKKYSQVPIDTIIPSFDTKTQVESRIITEEERSFDAFATLRKARKEAKLVGKRDE